MQVQSRLLKRVCSERQNLKKTWNKIEVKQWKACYALKTVITYSRNRKYCVPIEQSLVNNKARDKIP